MMKKIAQTALALFLALWLIGTPAWASATDWLVLAGHPFSPDAIAGLYGPALDLETGYAEGVAYAVAQYESERFHFYLDADRGWVIEAVALTGPSARVTIGGAAVGMASSRGEKRISRTRDRMVGSREAAFSATRKSTASPGGSSRVLSSAFWAWGVILSAP